MKHIFFFLVIIFIASCSSTDPEEEKRRYKKAEHMVHEAMEMMDLPEYGVKKLAKKGLYTSKDFIQASTDMMREGRVLKDLDHPDEKFMKMNQEMLDSFVAFEAAIKTKDFAKIKASLAIVNDTCKKCHDAYE